MPSASRNLALLGVGQLLLTARSVAAQRPRNQPIGGYIPGLAPAVVGIVLFGLAGIIATVHYARHGRKFMIPLLIGLYAFAGGLGARLANHFDPYTIKPFVAQQVIILACPCFFLATSYLVLDKLQNHLRVEKCLLLPAKWVVRLFCTGDVITFFLICAGGGTNASEKPSARELGKKLSTIGLSIQLAQFIIFMGLLGVFGLRVRSRYPEKWRYTREQAVGKSLGGFFSKRSVDDWKMVYWTQWLVSAGILTRSVYRIVEYADGYTGKLWLNEIWFWLLDALVLLLAMSVYLVVWPPRYLPRNSIVRGAKIRSDGLDDGHNMAEKDRRGWFGSKKRVNSDV